MQSYLKSRPVWIQFLLFIGLAVGIFMIISLAGMALLSAITGVSMFDLNSDVAKWSDHPNMITYVRGMLLIQFLGLFLIPSVLFAYFSDPAPLQYIGLKKPHKAFYWIVGIAALLIAVPMVEYTGFLNRKINFGNAQQWMQSMEDDAIEQLKFMLGKRTPVELLTNIIFIAAFAGIGEELFFRGVLQRLFIKAFQNPWLGIIFTAVLFSAMHMQFFGFFPRLLLGIVLGALYWYSGSIWTAIVAHFVYDAFFIVMAYFQPQMLENTEASLFNESSQLVLALVSTALVMLLLWLMKKQSKTTYTDVYRNDSINHQDFSF